jgi:hypothetical protein
MKEELKGGETWLIVSEISVHSPWLWVSGPWLGRTSWRQRSFFSSGRTTPEISTTSCKRKEHHSWGSTHEPVGDTHTQPQHYHTSLNQKGLCLTDIARFTELKDGATRREKPKGVSLSSKGSFLSLSCCFLSTEFQLLSFFVYFHSRFKLLRKRIWVDIMD